MSREVRLNSLLKRVRSFRRKMFSDAVHKIDENLNYVTVAHCFPVFPICLNRYHNLHSETSLTANVTTIMLKFNSILSLNCMNIPLTLAMLLVKALCYAKTR